MVLATLPQLRKLLLPWIGTMLVALLALESLAAQLRPAASNSGKPSTHHRGKLDNTVPRNPTYLWSRTHFCVGNSPPWRLAIANLGVLTTLLWPPAIGIVRLGRWPFARSLLTGWLLIPILGPLLVALMVVAHLFAPICEYRASGFPADCGVWFRTVSPLVPSITLGSPLGSDRCFLVPVRYPTSQG